MLLAIFGFDGTDEKVVKELGYEGPHGNMRGLKINGNRPTSCVFLLVPHRYKNNEYSLKNLLFNEIKPAMHPKNMMNMLSINTISVYCLATQKFIYDEIEILLPIKD